jgi:flagellin-like hook-associated protein FlgL
MGENGGSTARDLGLRTFGPATPIEQLNFGLGLNLDPSAADIRITAKNGDAVDVDLDGASTVGEVIARINDATREAGIDLQAGLAAVGNGITLTDGTGGDGTPSVLSINLSTAAAELGLATLQEGGEGEMVGQDVSPVRVDGVLSALVELEKALRDDDTSGIARSSERLADFTAEVTRIHGMVGARSQAMRGRLEQTKQATLAAEVLLSEVKDLDFAEAATKLQAAVTRLQAGLQTGALLLNVSLLDFLQ